MRAAIALAAAALCACADRVPTWNPNVQPIVARSCGGCHVERGIAPFTLQTFAEAVARKDLIRAQVESRRMPPWPPAEGCAEYAGDRSLPEQDRQTLLSWIDRGAPEGAKSDAPAATPTPVGLSRVDRELRIAAP